MGTIKERVNKILKAYIEFELDFKNLNENADLTNELNIDSVDVVDIIIDLENEFKINIDDDQIKTIRTYKDIIKLIEI